MNFMSVIIWKLTTNIKKRKYKTSDHYELITKHIHCIRILPTCFIHNGGNVCYLKVVFTYIVLVCLSFLHRYCLVSVVFLLINIVKVMCVSAKQNVCYLVLRTFSTLDTFLFVFSVCFHSRVTYSYTIVIQYINLCFCFMVVELLEPY